MKRSLHGAKRRSSTQQRKAQLGYWLRFGRRTLGLMILAGLVGLAVYQMQQLWDVKKFPLRHVNLQGTWHYLQPVDVQRTILSHAAKASFFALDVHLIQQQLSALPWVKSVKVQRRWPDSLDVYLEERTVFARWGEAGLLDSQGNAFQPNRLPPSQNWPLLHGAEGQERVVMTLYQSASQRLGKINLSISRLVQNARGAWQLQLHNGLELSLGRIQMLPRLERFVTLYPKALKTQLADIAEVDLRYRNGLAVRWNQLASAEPLTIRLLSEPNSG